MRLWFACLYIGVTLPIARIIGMIGKEWHKALKRGARQHFRVTAHGDIGFPPPASLSADAGLSCVVGLDSGDCVFVSGVRPLRSVSDPCLSATQHFKSVTGHFVRLLHRSRLTLVGSSLRTCRCRSSIRCVARPFLSCPNAPRLCPLPVEKDRRRRNACRRSDPR